MSNTHYDFLIPEDINTNLLTELLESHKYYINKNNPDIEEILYITNYFQLNNIILKLRYNNMLEYDEKYDIIMKKITLQRITDQVIYIPINTYSISCYGCVNITEFRG